MQVGWQWISGNVEAILRIPSSTNASEVRRIVAIAIWYQRFVPNFASVVAPLIAPLKKYHKLIRSPDCEEALRTIKEHLNSLPVLSCPDFSFPFVI